MKGLLYIWFVFFHVEAHDIHLSVTEMKRTGNHIEVVSKIFLDDLQTSMGLAPGEELPEDYKGADDLIQRFIDKSLIITFNEKPLKLKLAKTEAALPAVWVTFTADKVEWTDDNVFSVDNKIMTDLFEDQKNIFKIHINGKEDEHVFSSDQTIETFYF